MTRGLSPAYLTALADQVVRPVLFFEGEFPSGTLRLWSGVGSVTWNAQTWTGAGSLLGIGEMEEASDVAAAGWAVTLSGVPLPLVALAITDARQGLPGRVWLGLLDASGAIIADPSLAAGGRLDVPQINDGADSCTITISYEGRLIDLGRAREYRYTHESQQLIAPGDRGFEYVAGLQDRQITWGMNQGSGGGTVAPRAPAPRIRESGNR